MDKKIIDFDENDKRDTMFHKFDEHPEVAGILLGIDTGDYGNTFRIETFDGKTINVGSYTALANKIKQEDIGKAVKIVFLGKEKSKSSKNSYMNFQVYVKEVKGVDK